MKLKKLLLFLIPFILFYLLKPTKLFSEENPEFHIRFVGLGISTHLWGYDYKFLYHRKLDSSGVSVFNPGAAVDFGWYPKKDNWYINFSFSAFNDCWSNAFYVTTIGGGYNFAYKSFIANIGLAIGFHSQILVESILYDGMNYYVNFDKRKFFFFAAINSNIGFKITNNMALQFNLSFTYGIMFFGISYTLFLF